MTRLNTTRFALSVLLAGSAFAAVVPAQAQPMMGDMGMHHNEGRMQERMAKQWEKRQAELKTKLHLAAAQEPAWNAFVQSMKVPAARMSHAMDHDAMAKLSTPERMEKMNAMHEANQPIMQAHVKQRAEATRTFYNQLNAEQQKVFDAETLPEQSRHKGKHH